MRLTVNDALSVGAIEPMTVEKARTAALTVCDMVANTTDPAADAGLIIDALGLREVLS